MDAEFCKALQVKLLNIVRRRFDDNLELMMLEQAVRVVAVASVCRAAARLNVSHAPGFRAKHAQKRARVHGACTFFNIIGLG